MASVTVGMPVFNGAATLPRAIASLEAQTFRDVRFIVSDDGSSDDTGAVLAAWAKRDARVTVVRQPKNLGTIDNFEWLVERAESSFFMWAAQDDAWSRTYIAALLAVLQSRPGVDLATPLIQQVNPDFTDRKTIPYGPVPPGRRPSIRYHLSQARSGWFYGLYRREALAKALVIVREYGHPWGHDFVTLLPFALQDAIAGDNTAIFYQRITQGSEIRLKPRSARGRVALHFRFQKVALQELRRSALNSAERTLLTPAVWGYAAKHSIKLRRVWTKFRGTTTC